MGARSALSGSGIGGPAFRAAHATGPDWGQAASAALAALESAGLPAGGQSPS